MAIVHAPLFVSIKNKFANAVFAESNGKIVMRAMPFETKDAKTEKQLIQRNRFRIIKTLSKQIRLDIKQAYGSSLVDQTPHNRFVSINLTNAFEPDTFTINPEKFVICDNDGPRPDTFILTNSVPEIIHIVYTAHPRNSDEGALDMNFYILNPAEDTIWKSKTNCLYADQEVDIPVPRLSGSTVHIYCCTQDNVNLLDNLPRHIYTFCGTIKIQ
jgi:hypothetical protein